MRIRRRNLRKGLVAVGCLVGHVTFPVAAAGGVLIALGAALHVWSKGCLTQNRRLTTAGPYRFTRNPFYLANALIDLGLCLVIGSPWLAIVFLVLWTIAYRDTIAREEERLEALFPDEYPRYRARVPRFFPTGRSLPAELAEGEFSFDNDGLARGAEYARLMGIAIAPWAIAAAELLRRERLALLDEAHAAELAFVLALPALWVVKLALAETFRRPQTALLPWLRSRRLRGGLALALGIGALALAVSTPWLAVWPGLFCVLALLDLVGDRRARALDRGEGRQNWRNASAVAAGSLVAVACVAVLRQAL